MPGADRRGERRKYGSNSRKNGTNTKRKDWVRAYWNSMSLEMKRKLLKIKVSDLKSYFGSSKNGLASDVLNEALACSEENRSSPEKESLRDGCISCPVSNNNSDKVYNIEGKEFDGNQLSIACTIESWPISEDSERAKLLEKIHDVFQALIAHKYLAASHLNKVIKFTMDELQSLATGSQLLNHVGQTPICICFLGAFQLKKVLKFLQELSHSCGIGRSPEKSSVVDDMNTGAKGPEIKENIVLNSDASCLYLDKCLLLLEYAPSACSDDDATTTTSTIVGNGDGVLPDSLYERKYEHLSYEQALQAVEDLCLEEGKKRETDMLFEHRSYNSALRQRREKLVENEHDALFISSRFEVDAISNVLKEADTLNVNQYGYEDTYGGITSQFCDLESGEDALLTFKVVQRSKIDAQIMRIVTGMQQLELKLESVSAFDYQSILPSLVKSYMRAHLDDLAEKNATEKSNAAREAFLAELALDSKKGTQG
ncbi:hypothetical protein OIU84_001687 [Salix udensis]|uniref:DUF629 domain-containing protein n=1 Tax=Salix udensis TaxID=889485 RepID=A0AAD6P718_9ROSI|nr:hypothetical protein OIU84_001687 [Salix udensis]